MSLLKPVLSLRTKSHVNSRLQIKDERNFAKRVPAISVAFVAFSAVDSLAAPDHGALYYFLLRLAAVTLAAVLYKFARGRTRYGLRFLLLLAPYIYCVEYIMLSEGLSQSPYFAGLALVMFSGTILFPTPGKIASIVYGLSVLPAVVSASVHPFSNHSDLFCFLLMTIGCAVLCSLNSHQAYHDLRERLHTSELLARDRGRRGKEIQDKAEELLKRKVFETQFSPQVVSAVLERPSLVQEMERRNICTIVIDIENSTMQANTLDPGHFKEVVQEVFDVFTGACMKCNVTMDKFTGDGAQAFAGAPVGHSDDPRRALNACRETIQILNGRKGTLEGLWKRSLNVRFAISEGSALVGFLGKGAIKSFTAIGDTVSFAHRICGWGVTDPWTVGTYSWITKHGFEETMVGWETTQRLVAGLKGFSDQQFSLTLFKPKFDVEPVIDTGRCDVCQTPLFFEDGPGGLPRLFCPACRTSGLKAA